MNFVPPGEGGGGGLFEVESSYQASFPGRCSRRGNRDGLSYCLPSAEFPGRVLYRTRIKNYAPYIMYMSRY